MEKEIKMLIENNPLALATTNERGIPHVIAVADVKVISENEILIGDNYMKTTVDNIKKNQKVSLCVWENDKGSEASGYRLDGIASYFTSGKFLQMIKKIHKGCPAKGAIVIRINNVKKLAG